jgi:hypothetical protein
LRLVVDAGIGRARLYRRLQRSQLPGVEQEIAGEAELAALRPYRARELFGCVEDRRFQRRRNWLAEVETAKPVQTLRASLEI